MALDSYVLVTAAFNEERFIGDTIRSVTRQSHPPTRWVIVSDGSTDGTDDIVRGFAKQYSYIELLRLTKEHVRNFGAQAHAINCGIKYLDAMPYRYIGNLDADVSLEPSHFERLTNHFNEHPRLGLGGGFIYDRERDGTYRNRWDNTVRSVAHAVQLFRRECFEAIGGAYLPLPYGGPDTYAEIMSRMKGWEVMAFSDLKVLHHRPGGAASGLLKGRFNMGRMDYSLGYLPGLEIAKILRRVRERPFVVSALARLAGFVYCYCVREARPVSQDAVNFLREEQKERLRKMWTTKDQHP